VSDNGHIVLDIWVAVEKLVASPPDENAGEQKNDHGYGERDAQRRDASLFNYRDHQRNIGFHAKKLSALLIGCSNASGGFSDATEERIATPSSEIGAASSC
jgi:hypothetical protein